MKNRVKYFDSHFVIPSHRPNFFGIKMISAKRCTNGESLTQFEGVHRNDGRIPAESPNNIYHQKQDISRYFQRSQNTEYQCVIKTQVLGSKNVSAC